MNKMKYINKIKGNISIYSRNKTINILDGLSKSIYKGKSMDFDDLREYTFGDDVKDIDWKASARSTKPLVRRFVAEKKHNILCIMDSGKKMLADTSLNEKKQDLAIFASGTLAYIANYGENLVSFAFNKKNNIELKPFRFGLSNIELSLGDYDKNMDITDKNSLDDILLNVLKKYKRKMIIFIITDISGIDNIQEETIKKISVYNDLYVINISDADIISKDAFDIEQDRYISKLISNNKKIEELNKRVKEEIYNKCKNKLKKYNISSVTIESNEQILNKIIALLKESKNANIR